MEIPPSWKAQPEGNKVRLVVVEGVSIEIPDLTVVPEDVWNWSQGSATRDLGGGTSVVITNKFDSRTNLGWPIAIYESVARNSSGEDVQWRMHAVFSMIEHGSIVVARATSFALFQEHREAVIAALSTARPDWGNAVRASLRDLYT